MQTLIAVGRSVVLVAAFLTVAAFTIGGWSYGMAQDRLRGGVVPTGFVSSTPVMYGVLGFVAGLIFAGSAFGLAAAMFDMQRSLRILVRRDDVQQQSYRGQSNLDTAPLVVTAGRTEPQLKGTFQR